MGYYVNPSAESFAAIVRSGIYVDKSGLIAYMNKVVQTDRMLVCSSRPRRFGKTLNMDMLLVFFEISDEDTSIYFKEKAIWKCGQEYTRHQGNNSSV